MGAATEFRSVLEGRATAILAEYRESKSIADSDRDSLILAAIVDTDEYAAIVKARAALDDDETALRNSVADSINMPSESDVIEATREIAEQRVKMAALIDTIGLLIPDFDGEPSELLGDEFVEIANSGKKSKGKGGRKPRYNSVIVRDTEGTALVTWTDSKGDNKPTHSKLAEFLGIDASDLLTHIPDPFNKGATVEFAIVSPSHENKNLMVTITANP